MLTYRLVSFADAEITVILAERVKQLTVWSLNFADSQDILEDLYRASLTCSILEIYFLSF